MTSKKKSTWFPKPDNCTCAYDAGWIYTDPDCPAHRHIEDAWKDANAR